MLELRTVSNLKELALERGWSYRTLHPAVTLRFRPSLTTTENFERVLAGHGAWVADWETRLSSENRFWALRNYKRLYAVVPYGVAESFSCEIPDAFLIGVAGVAATADGALLVQSFVEDGAAGTRRAVVAARPDFARAPRLRGTFLSLRVNWDWNYCHWLLNGLPRLTALGAPGALDPSLRFLLPAPLLPFQRDSLRLLGIGDDRCVEAPGDGCVSVDRLVLCQPAPKTNVPVPAHLLAVSEHIKRGIGVGASSSRRLYVSRVGNRRVVVNEDELMPILAAFGFERVRCEALTFAEQVRSFAEASVVLGPHGAGLTNHIFCPPGAKVIELYHPVYWSNNVQRTADLYGHEHWHLHGVPVHDLAGGCELPMRVPPDALRELLSLASPP